MDTFTEHHMRAWIADHHYTDESEGLLFDAMAHVVDGDSRFLDDGWPRVAQEARDRYQTTPTGLFLA